MGSGPRLSLSVKIPCERKFLNVLKPLIVAMSQKAGFSGSEAYEIAASVDQVIAALIKGARPGKTLEVVLLTGAASIRVEVLNGTSKARLRELDRDKETDLKLAYRVMDVLRFGDSPRRTKHGPICVMEKFLRRNYLGETP